MFKSINFSPKDSDSETMVGFAIPKTENEALNCAKRTVRQDMQHTSVKLIKNPPAHGQYVWTAYAGKTVLGWITLTPA